MPGRRRISALALVAILSACAGRQKDTVRTELPVPKRDLVVPGQGFLKTFDNGLTLFVVPDAYTRLVQFDVRQAVGSREDPPGKTGMAHFVEHLMFQMPVDGPGTTRVMADLPQHTLFFNAYTAADQTHYIHTGTSDQLEQYFKYTALRLGYDCSAVEDNQFLREREVVRNEHRWRGQAIEVFVIDKVNQLAFPEGHPYRRSLLGGDAELTSITPKDTCEFIKRYYTPSQAHVVIAGDVDPNKALELAKKYLEPLPKFEAPPRAPVPPPVFSEHAAQIKAPVKKPTAVILFKMPKRFTDDAVAAFAAAETMFLSIAFFVDMKKGRESVVGRWYVVPLGGKEAQLLGVAIETKNARDLDRGIDEVLDAVSRGFAADVSGKDYQGAYDSARQRARLQVIDGVSSLVNRGDAYADYLEEGAHPGFVGAELAKLDKLTTERVQQVGRKVFARDAAMVVKVVPDGKEKKVERAGFDYKPQDEESLGVPDDIDPAEAHRPLPLDDIAPPEGQSVELTLDSGLRVVLVQSSEMPTIDIQVIIGGGTLDSNKAPDVAQLAGRFWGPGDSLESRNLMTFFENAGGIFDQDVGPYSTTYMSRGLAIYLDFIIAGLSERVVQAEYSTGALEGWKEARKDQLKKKSALQAAQRTNAFNVALYGKGHPHVQEIIVDRDKLRSITLNDIEGFRDRYYRAGNSAVIMTGGFDMELALKYVEAYFGKPALRHSDTTWNQKRVNPQRKAPPEPKPGAIRYMTEVDKEKSMTDVTIAYPLAEVYGDDHAALAVLADMLNHGVSAVRMQLGASYGVYARLDTERPRIVVGGALDSGRAADAHKAIRGAIQRLKNDEEFDREFAFARRNVLRGMINAQADARLLANQLADAVRNGRSYDYFNELARRVATLEPEKVKAMIAKVLDDDRSVTLVQGPAAGVKNLLDGNGIANATKLPDAVHEADED